MQNVITNIWNQMFIFFHTYTPNSILISLGPLKIYWYGMFIVVGLLLAIFTTFKLAEYYGIKKENIIDLSFWLITGGIIGARLYHVFLEYDYYLSNPLSVLKIWNGGLAIHGAIIIGAIIIYRFIRKNGYSFWLITSIITPGLALGQALGRWGNYFNQEIFGKPTDMPWGIPIEFLKRPHDYSIFTHFHPTFLYESIGSLIIFGLLLWLHKKAKQGKNVSHMNITLIYLISYSFLRLLLEFIRLDDTLIIFGIRWPQIISIIIILFSIAFIIYKNTAKNNS